MGWTYTSMDKGQAGDYFKNMLNWETETASNKLLRGAFKGFREYYGAVETTIKATGEKRVWAFTAMIDWRKNDYNNFGYKDMDETMGPYMFNCPKTILDLLTPTDNEYANKWRNSNWERINNTLKVKDGDIIKLKNPIRFRGGQELDTFRVEKKGRKTSYYHPSNNYGRYLVKKAWLVGAKVISEKELNCA